jgi:hypothetical protein
MGTLGGGWGEEQVSGIHEDDIFPFVPETLDESGSPGQTAKRFIPSPAGFKLAEDVRGKNQNRSPRRVKGRALPPKREREDKDEQHPPKKSNQTHLLKIEFPKLLPLS